MIAGEREKLIRALCAQAQCALSELAAGPYCPHLRESDGPHWCKGNHWSESCAAYLRARLVRKLKSERLWPLTTLSASNLTALEIYQKLQRVSSVRFRCIHADLRCSDNALKFIWWPVVVDGSVPFFYRHQPTSAEEDFMSTQRERIGIDYHDVYNDWAIPF